MLFSNGSGQPRAWGGKHPGAKCTASDAAGRIRPHARRRAAAPPPRAALVNHYEVLGLPPDAPAEAVKARYRELAKATHPDAGGGGGVEAFLAVRRAYDVLSQEMLRAEHDQQLGLATARNNDPRFARFNRWRAEVVPELRGQMRLWSEEVYQIIRHEAARWRSLLDRARRAADAAAAASDALAARRGSAGAAAVGGAGAGRFEAAGGALPHRTEGAPSVPPTTAAGSSGDERGAQGGGGDGGGAKGGCGGADEVVRLQEELRQHLSDLWAAVRDLQRGVREGQACVQRQYDKRLEQVDSRYRVYGEIVWYDIWEEVAGPWLSDAERQTEGQAAELATVEAQARELTAKADEMMVAV